MNRTELTELIQNGENSGVEFKRDDIVLEKLAKEMAALLNLEGGHILLGVEDDRTVSGLSREPGKAEEWVMEAARVHLRPAAIPYWETIEWSGGMIVGIVSLPADAPDKPYKAKRGSAWVTQIRVGTTTRDATDEEEARLYQQSGRLQYDRKPVPGSLFTEFDRRRLINYFRDIRRQACPDEGDDEGWIRLLANTELMAEDRGRSILSVGGLLLFGVRPNKYLPQAGLTAVAYPGTNKDYEAKERAVLRGPAVALLSEAGDVVETGVIGLLLYVAMVGALIASAVRSFRASHGAAQLLPAFALGTVMVHFFPLMVTQSMFSNWPAIVLWYSLSVAFAALNLCPKNVR